MMDEIQDGNNEIAKFCGNKFIKEHFFSDLMDVEYELMDLDDLKFHSDWSWIMPVWFKFRDLRFDAPELQMEHSMCKDLILRAICFKDTSPIDAFETLCKSIKWYNESK